MRRSSACSTQDEWRGRDWKLASRFAGECIRLGRSEEASPCSTGNGKEVGELVERGSIQRGGFFLVCLFVCLFLPSPQHVGVPQARDRTGAIAETLAQLRILNPLCHKGTPQRRF